MSLATKFQDLAATTKKFAIPMVLAAGLTFGGSDGVGGTNAHAESQNEQTQRYYGGAHNTFPDAFKFSENGNFSIIVIQRLNEEVTPSMYNDLKSLMIKTKNNNINVKIHGYKVTDNSPFPSGVFFVVDRIPFGKKIQKNPDNLVEEYKFHEIPQMADYMLLINRQAIAHRSKEKVATQNTPRLTN